MKLYSIQKDLPHNIKTMFSCNTYAVSWLPLHTGTSQYTEVNYTVRTGITYRYAVGAKIQYRVCSFICYAQFNDWIHDQQKVIINIVTNSMLEPGTILKIVGAIILYEYGSLIHDISPSLSHAHTHTHTQQYQSLLVT